MPRRNRVQPDGSFLAHPARGAFMGNRGILHDAQGRLTHRRWATRGWVISLLSFAGRPARQIMAPGRYTELFFHDEAVALAAGHRPCAQCRFEAHQSFRRAAGIEGSIGAFDKELHAARAIPRVFGQRRHSSAIADLPDGTFIAGDDGKPALIHQGLLYPFTPEGYAAPRPLPRTGEVTVLTPEPTVNALRGGYAPVIRL